MKVAAKNLGRKPYITWAVKRVTRSLQVLWPRSRTNIFGSNATGLALPTSDVDLVVCLPPVRNLVKFSSSNCLLISIFSSFFYDNRNNCRNFCRNQLKKPEYWRVAMASKKHAFRYLGLLAMLYIAIVVV